MDRDEQELILQAQKGDAMAFEALVQNMTGRYCLDSGARDAEILDRLQEAVEKLAPQQKLVFTLRHYEGQKLKDIAERMNCTEGAVKKYLFLATEKIRKEMRSLL